MTIRRMGQEKWQVSIEAGRDRAGKRRRVTRYVYGARADAERAHAELLLRTSRRVEGTAGRTLADALDRWLNVQPGSLAGTTVAEYRRLAERVVIPVLGDVPLTRLDPVRLEDFYLDLTARGLAPNSVRKVHSLIRRACTHAGRWGWMSDNPAARAQPPAFRRPLIEPPADDVVADLFRLADGDEFGGLGVGVRLAAFCGLRRGEVLGLQIADVDLERNELVVRRALEEVRRRGTSVKLPKSGQQRAVPLPLVAAGPLRAWMGAAELRASAGGQDGPLWLFSPSPVHDRPWTPSAWSHRWRKVRTAAGADGVRFHDLRHWYATRLLDLGIPEATVAGMLGHESLATLRRVYSHRVDSTARRAADALDDSWP